MIAAVVLDMDGLMLDTEAMNRVAWKAAAAEQGFDLTDNFYATLIGQTTPVSEQQVVDHFGSDFSRDLFRARRRLLWRTRADAEGIPQKPGLIAFLDAMAGLDLPMAVATSTATEGAEFSLERAGIRARFRAVVAGDQVPRGKPAPDIYLEAATRLAVEPRFCIALEDSSPGILAATSAGMRALLIPDLAAPTAPALQAAHQRFTSLWQARDWVVAAIAATRAASGR